MRVEKSFSGRQSGFSLIEMLCVVAVILIVAAVGIPQLVASRRLVRTAGISREIVSQLRFARQEAISQRQAVTFSYDDTTKQVKIIDHQGLPTGTLTQRTAIVTDGSYPITAGSVVIRTSPLTGGGVPASEITYGIPTGLPNGQLDDTATMSPLVNNKINITFFPDGSATNSVSATTMALYLYNPKVPSSTAMAISVLGSGGRVKVWRYNSSGNKYYE